MQTCVEDVHTFVPDVRVKRFKMDENLRPEPPCAPRALTQPHSSSPNIFLWDPTESVNDAFKTHHAGPPNQLYYNSPPPDECNINVTAPSPFGYQQHLVPEEVIDSIKGWLRDAVSQ
jgi:hypothetical protein